MDFLFVQFHSTIKQIFILLEMLKFIFLRLQDH